MHRSILLLLAALTFVTTTSAQKFDLEAFLTRAREATENYQDTFKNLVAEEQRVIEYYRADGTLEDTRRIRSVFVVYESPFTKRIGEFRNVVDYNGKNVARKDEDVAKFFDKLSKAFTDDEQMMRLRQEGDRFDGRSSSYGLTLAQTFVLSEVLRPFFSFRVVGKQKIEGHDVLIVEYEQTETTPLIKAHPSQQELKKEPRGAIFDSEMPDKFRPTNPLVHGKFWLDAKTAQLWRNAYSVTIRPSVLTTPIVNMEFVYEYQPSEFGALLPKKLQMVGYRLKGSSDTDLQRTKAVNKIFEYSNFRKPNTEVKGTQIETPNAKKRT